MEKEEIFKSGFIEAFIEEYFSYYTYNHSSKVRLLYILCSSEEEKEEVTIEQISHAKIKISELGFDELSFSYLKSGKKESLEYIAEKRHEFWVNKFAESFEGDILYFNPIYEAVCLYNEVKKISKKCFETEEDFWEFYPDIQKPKIRDIITIFTNEVELIEHIEFEIDNYIESEYWEFDFDEYQKYIKGSKPLELLFNLCELLVQLDRLEMFNSFKQSEQLISTQQTKTEQEQEQPTFTNNFDSVDENEIYRYFYDKLVKKKMLTETELNEFLTSAFQENTPQKKRFKLKNVPTKGKVTNIFYGYFKDLAQKPHGKQEQYASLLGEYFEGYKTSTIKTNFSK